MEIGVVSGKASNKIRHPFNSSEVMNGQKPWQITPAIQKILLENDNNEEKPPVGRQIPQNCAVSLYHPNLNVPEISLMEIGMRCDYFSTNQRKRISAMIKRGTDPELAKQKERERYAALMASRSPSNYKQDNPVKKMEEKPPAELWEDPLCSDQVSLKMPETLVETSMNILDLFDDCLAIICQKLELRDQIQFAMTCQTFHNIYLSYCSPRNVIIKEMDCSLSFMEKRLFFEIAGPNIKSFRATNTSIFKKCEKQFFNHIFKCTPNIENICLSSSRIESRCLQKLCRSIKTLISVDLSYCNLRDEDIWLLQKLPNLEILKLAGNSRITGKNMQAHRKLKVINFQRCYRLEFRFFKALCKSNINLHSINIESCFKLCNINAELVKVLSNLESLAISCCFEVKCMPKLSKLKNLSLEYRSKPELQLALEQQNTERIEYLAICALGPCIDMESISRFTGLKTLYISALDFGVTDEHLTYLLKLPNLEMISIQDSIKSDEITTAALVNLFKNCNKLREITLITVFNLTNEFIFDVINVLREYQLQKLTKLHVWRGYELNESILEDPRYLAATSFFKMDFEIDIRRESFDWSGII